MKKVIKSTVAILLCLTFSVCLISCNDVDATGLWEDATYLKETTLGEGKTEFYLSIEAGEQKLKLTIKTDKEMLGDALYELELTNDPSFFDTLNGIELNWDETHMYWAFYIGEQYATSGVNQTVIENGATYRFVCSK